MAITITNVTEKIAVNGEMPIMFGDSGLIQEVFEAVNDANAVTTNTSLGTVTPRFIQDIRSINATLALSDNLNLATTNATVTLTVQNAVPASTKYRITLIGRR
jgi:hypothetical protein